MIPGSTAHRPRRPAPSPSGAEPAPNPSPASASAPRGRAPSGMRPHEDRLSGYLLARAAMGRKIDDAAEISKPPNGRTLKSENVLKDLRAANDTVEETRRLLPNGRGNVKGDIIATRGEASRRYAAGAIMTQKYLEKMGIREGSDPRFAMQVETAVSLFTGQASCGGSALVAAHVHAPKLGKGRMAAAVANVEADHMWTEARRSDSHRDNDQIIDRWTSGPAILKEDSSYGLDPKVREAYPLYGANRDKALGNVNRILSDLKKDHALQAEFRANMEELDRMDYRFGGKIWDEESVLGEGFRRKAGDILHPDPSPAAGPDKVSEKNRKGASLPYRHEALAAGVARSLGEGVRGAVEKAPGILETAKRMFPKPSPDQAGPSRS